MSEIIDGNRKRWGPTLVVFTNTREIDQLFHAMLFENRFGADTRPLQDARGAECSCGNNDQTTRACNGNLPIGISVHAGIRHIFNADSALVPARDEPIIPRCRETHLLEDDTLDKVTSGDCDVLVTLVVNEVVWNVLPLAGFRRDPPYENRRTLVQQRKNLSSRSRRNTHFCHLCNARHINLILPL